MKVKYCTGLLAGLTLGLMPLAHADSPATEAPSWYATVTGGMLLNPRDSTAKVQLGQAPPAVTLDGHMHYDGAETVAVAIGKQGHTEQKDASEEPTHWRVEAEYWHGRWKRTSFDAGVLQTDLKDSTSADALFVNAMLRVFATDETRWWLGAGIGYAKVRMPDASSPTTCSCLRSAQGEGVAAQIKLLVEKVLSERSSAFLQLGYLQVPGTHTSFMPANSLASSTTHDRLRSGNVAIGYLMRF